MAKRTNKTAGQLSPGSVMFKPAGGSWRVASASDIANAGRTRAPTASEQRANRRRLTRLSDSEIALRGAADKMLPAVAPNAVGWHVRRVPKLCRLNVSRAEFYVQDGPNTLPGNRVVCAVYSVDGEYPEKMAERIALLPELAAALRAMVDDASVSNRRKARRLLERWEGK